MQRLFNKLHAWRETGSTKNLYDFSLKSKYALRNAMGYWRGLRGSLSGKIKYEEQYRPLIIGAGTELLIRPGSSIILKNTNKNEDSNVFYNNPLFPTASTIGLRPHYSALDPPSLNTTRIELLDGANLSLERNTIILSGSYITGSNNAQISIGENSYISQEVILNARCSIKIGKNTMVGHQTRIMDYDAHAIAPINIINAKQIMPSISKKIPVIIGDNVWIGFRVTILKGVTIGNGSMIGANSCVVSNIPANSIAVGNPARIVRENITWQR